MGSPATASLVTLIALLAAGCSGDPAPPRAPPVATAPAPVVAAPNLPAAGAPALTERHKDRPDVIVIVLDTLRADHLTQYGYRQATSPGLRAFAASATRFDEAYAPASWTVPSTASIMSGLLPLRHRLRHAGDVLPAEVDTLAERLGAAGWRTAAFSHNLNVSKAAGFDQGFEDFTTFTGKVLDYPHIAEMTKEVRAWVAAHGDDPFLLYLQPMNCHGPYRVPSNRADTLLGHAPNPKFKYYKGPMAQILRKGQLGARAQVTRTYLRSLKEHYDTAIRYSLDEVGRLLDDLRAQGLFDESLIVLTADHGEELFDHGGFSHGYSLHKELLRVPLFVKLPGQTHGGLVADRVSLTDIVPTILDATQAVAPAAAPAGVPLDGRSLVPLLKKEHLPPKPLLFDVDFKRRCVAQAVLDGDWKLISIRQNYEGLAGVEQLYNVAVDPDEEHDVAAANPERIATLQAELDKLAADASTGGIAAPKNILSAMDQEQLEALGYLE
jgi:arylsulfatase A-like enzyme